MFLLLLAALSLSALDGDTVRLADGRTIRIANIDAPEIRTARCDAEKRLGRAAKRRLEALLASGRVVVIPGDPASGRKIDRHGRLLATVQVDGRDVGAILIAEDLARPWTGKRQPWCERVAPRQAPKRRALTPPHGPQ